MIKRVSRLTVVLILALSLLSAMTVSPAPEASAIPPITISATYDADGNPTITMEFADTGADHYRWNLIRGPVHASFNYENNECAGQCSTIGIGMPTSLDDVVAVDPWSEASYWVIMRSVHDGVNGEWTQAGPLTLLSSPCEAEPGQECGLRMIW